MKADEGAPVFSRGRIDIAASPETLWDLMQTSQTGWTGRTFGIDAVHVWRFEPDEPPRWGSRT
jgi:hypothetical protein